MDDFEKWAQSNELREVIERELDNWGDWSRIGGRVKLLYPASSAGFVTPPRRASPVVNTKLAENTEHVLSTWKLTSDLGHRMTFLLKLVHVEHQPLEKIQHDFERKFKAKVEFEYLDLMIDTARRMYWMLTK